MRDQLEVDAKKLSKHRVRLAAAKAEQAEMVNALKRRELVPLQAVEREWSIIIAAIRARMLAVPARVQSRMGYLTSADIAGIDREIRDALAELGTPSKGLETSPGAL